jgi:hypothetical protein
MRAPADDEMHLFQPLIAEWSRRQKLRTLYLGGLSISKTNVGGICFARHWPHLLCWQWSVSINPFRPGFDTYRRFLAHVGRYNGGGVQAYVIILGCRFGFSRQPYDWMVARQRRDEALGYVRRRVVELGNPTVQP